MARPQAQPRTLRGLIDAKTPADIAESFRYLAGFFDEPLAYPRMTVAAQAADTRAITIQVEDRRRADWPDRWLVAVVIPASAYGPPVAPDSVSATVGSLVYEDGGLLVGITDSSGTLTLGVEFVSPTTVYPYALVLGRAAGSDAVAFT